MPIEPATAPPRDERRGGRHATTYDFRRPSTLGRDVLRVLELGHETFSRRLGSGWGAELRTMVQVEQIGTDQSIYDDHVRSMPSPNVAILVSLAPLPGTIVVDCNVQLALQMVDRLLGASAGGAVVPPRRPSDVEADLITHLAHQVVVAIGETLSPLVDVALEPRLVGLEFNPQLVQVAAPSDPALLLSYRVGITGSMEASGFLTIAYPGPVLSPLLELMGARRASDDGDAIDTRTRQVVEASLSDVDVTLAVRLNATAVAAADLAALAVGDVLRMDHRVDLPARGVVGGQDVLRAHLGRRGSRLAVQVREWTVAPSPAPSRRSTDLGAHVDAAATDRGAEPTTDPPVRATEAPR